MGAANQQLSQAVEILWLAAFLPDKCVSGSASAKGDARMLGMLAHAFFVDPTVLYLL